jgi:hypothetical protein
MKPASVISFFLSVLFLLSFAPHGTTRDEDPQAYALVVSVPKVDNALLKIKYGLAPGSSYADLPGSSLDGERISAILLEQGFPEANILRIGKKSDDIVTEETIIEAFNQMAAKVKANDLFVFYYSGHGTSVKDQPGGDEADNKDEAFVTYKSYLLDDKINEIYRKNFSGTRNIMIADACHGGSMYELFKKTSIVLMDNSKAEKTKEDTDAEAAYADCNIAVTTDEKTGFTMLYFGASRDENNGYATKDGGFFTAAITGVYHPVYWQNIAASDLPCKISVQMKAIGDPGKGEIKYVECGKPSDDFKNSYLFKIK